MTLLTSDREETVTFPVDFHRLTGIVVGGSSLVALSR